MTSSGAIPNATRLLLAVGTLASLVSCSSIQVALGLKMRLDKVPVTAVNAWLVPASGVAPGASAKLVIAATSSDGRQFVTEGAGHGKVLFDSYTISSSLAAVDEDGVVTIPADPRITDGHTPHIHIVPKAHSDVSADLDVSLRYDVAYKADFSGRAGSSGSDGLSGMDGLSGSNGSTDPNNSSPGGNGGNGSDGGNGGDGSPGGPGEAVHVWLTMAPRHQPGAAPLLQARVASASHERLYLIDPAGGTLAVSANGGPGGSGGRGGRGGMGGAGGSGWPPGSSGLSGLAGRDGSNGSPGAAGTILVSVDPQADSYLDRLRLSNTDGAGRQGPARVIRVEPVPALW
jgi:hypothetical protein